MKRKAGASATLLQDKDSTAELIDSHDVVVVGFFKVGLFADKEGVGHGIGLMAQSQ